MKIVHRLPAAPLRSVIDRYWSWEGADALRLLPLMPSPGGLEIFFHYGRPFAARNDCGMDTLPQAHLSCVRTQPVELFQHGGLGFIAVRIKAGAGTQLTGMPVTLFADSFIAATDVWGEAANDLLEQIAQASSMDERVALLDSFFLAQRQRPRRGAAIDLAVGTLLQQPSRVADIARDVGLGARQLEKRFRAATGLTPARFRRLARLRRSIRSLLLAPPQTTLPQATLTTLIDTAYYDQAQQVREFRELTGFTPGELRRVAPDYSHFYNPPWPK
ncbi:AraC family transcriptional regulator [Dyella subtropica]|uniref:AraC family transcriptional regulator n=1 Tax=Dyella subtropica TaxID=2992127 RepID=UPI00225967C6|nr:AraC family transcriptional regulator [Dyella subtropica]